MFGVVSCSKISAELLKITVSVKSFEWIGSLCQTPSKYAFGMLMKFPMSASDWKETETFMLSNSKAMGSEARVFGNPVRVAFDS